jgi:hypothetical protein
MLKSSTSFGPFPDDKSARPALDLGKNLQVTNSWKLSEEMDQELVLFHDIDRIFASLKIASAETKALESWNANQRIQAEINTVSSDGVSAASRLKPSLDNYSNIPESSSTHKDHQTSPDTVFKTRSIDFKAQDSFDETTLTPLLGGELLLYERGHAIAILDPRYRIHLPIMQPPSSPSLPQQQPSLPAGTTAHTPARTWASAAAATLPDPAMALRPRQRHDAPDEPGRPAGRAARGGRRRGGRRGRRAPPRPAPGWLAMPARPGPV